MSNINKILDASIKSLENGVNIPLDFSTRLLAKNDKRNRIIIGPRGTGKSTYLLFEAQKYKKEEVLFIDIDSALLTSYDFSTNNNALKSFKSDLVEILSTDKIKMLVFDEVQNLYQWNVFLKQLADTFKNIRIIASGSDARAIMSSSELGTRRYELYFSGFYTFKEYKDRFKDGNIEDYLLNWSFASGEKLSDSDIFQSVYENQMKLTRLKGFSVKNVLKLISYNPSTSFNINAMANAIFEDSGVRPDDTQLKMILKFLEDSSLIYVLRDKPSADRISKRNKYKLYAADWNLFKYFSGKTYKDLGRETTPRRGLIFENMVISNVFAHNNLLIERERIKTTVGNPDVDFIINDVSYEVKSFDTLDKSNGNYQKIIDKALATKAKIIHTGKTKTLKINIVQNIEYINVEEFLVNIDKFS